MSFSGQIYPEDTVAYFRIASAAGRQPIEPIAIGEFRIGSASHCQLRLGDATMPDIHTVLTVEPDRVLLQSQATNPPLFVNGTAITECDLRDGDLVEIQDLRLLFRLVASEDRITLDESGFVSDADSVQTAAQVVDRLGEQIDLVESLARTPDTAVLELLNAVAQTQTAPNPAAAPEPEVSELGQVVALLQKHHEASRIRLESLTEVLDNVVGQQKLIADTLEVMSNRIQALDSGPGYQHRASA